MEVLRIGNYLPSEFLADTNINCTVMKKESIKTSNPPELVEYHRPPTKEEIKFGEGATHYMSFDICDVLKPNGRLKRWVRCKYDGLRYYR